MEQQETFGLLRVASASPGYEGVPMGIEEERLWASPRLY
jgi:hypothetical protein